MIGSLRGKLIDKRPNQVLLDVGGVGYQVQVPLSTFAVLGSLHDETTLLIHTHVREDQFNLFGFFTAREKHCFELLISAIRKGDLAQLVRIPGVGRKTAERMVVELRDKLAAVDVREPGKPSTRSQLESDVASALVNLGYDEREVEKAIAQSRATVGNDFETLLRASLQMLGGAVMKKSQRAGQGE